MGRCSTRCGLLNFCLTLRPRFVVQSKLRQHRTIPAQRLKHRSGGCIAGAGTLADPAKSAMMLNKYKNEAAMKVATETPYQDSLDLLKY